ncbi:MFS transporter [Streptomyces sp. NPDC057682]|uniref:MFS transporter n=1 Tax=Streptomyces sp. NPDC057682 TaxID=3346210 RepID=UPI0036B3815B
MGAVNGFDTVGAAYAAHRNSARGRLRHDQVERRLLAELPAGAVRVLDVGFGNKADRSVGQLGRETRGDDPASIALVPEIVDGFQMHPANARVAGAFSLADMAGVYGGTLVVGLAGGVRVLWMNAASYLVSAWCAWRIRPQAVRQEAQGRPVQKGAAIRDGVGYVMRDRIQRPLVLSLVGHAYADGIMTTFLAYTLLTRLGSDSSGLGLVMGVTAAGGLVGAALATRLVNPYEPARVMLAGFLACIVCGVPLLVARPGPVWLGVIALAGAVRAAAAVAAGSAQRSLRHQLCPPELQSRAQQTSVWLVTGLRPAGGLAAAFSVHAALPVGTALYLVPAGLLWSSPVRRLTAMPAPAAAKEAAHAR